MPVKPQTLKPAVAGGYQAEVLRFLYAIGPTAKDWLFLTYDDYRGSEPKAKSLTFIERGNFEEQKLRQILREKNAAGAGVYVKLNKTRGKDLKAGDVIQVRALMLDLDGSPLEPVLKCPLPPHAVVETSPGRYHCYWRVIKDFPIDQYEAIQLGLAKRFDGDPAVAKLSTLARLPGFRHVKDIDDPHLVTLHTVNDLAPYSFEQITAEFPPAKEPHKPTGSPRGAIILSTSTPVHSAEQFLEQRYSKGGVFCLVFYQGCFYKWVGTHYAEVDENDVRSELYAFLLKAITIDKGKPAPFNPTQAKVNNILDALKMGVLLTREHRPPCWIPPLQDAEVEGLIACHNGLLNTKTRVLTPHSPLLFNVNSLPFDYDPQAPTPKRWNKFLRELWPGDNGKQARLTLQQMFGLMLTEDTSFHKVFLIIGPPRSGKGTIGRVLKSLLGKDNVVNSTLASMTGEFGLWPLIDKRVAIISDARLGARSDAQVVAERLLSISGEDDQNINRKNLPFWSGRLGVRFLVMTNKPPSIADASGALVSRYVVLTLQQSFLGREDRELTARLLIELPGILNWALRGLDRLYQRGHFRIPKASRDMVRALQDAASPVGHFVREWCEVGPGKRVHVNKLYAAYKVWCERQGDKNPIRSNAFGMQLREAQPHVVARGRAPDRFYQGLCLNGEGEKRYAKSIEGQS